MAADPGAQRVLDAVFRETKAIAGASATASVEIRRSANTRFARGEVTQTGESDDAVLSVEIAFGQRHAAVTTNQLDPASVKAAVQRAARLARIAPEDKEAMPPLGPQRYPRTPPAADPALGRFDAAARAEVVGQALAAAGEGTELAGFSISTLTSTSLGSSAGLRAGGEASTTELTLTARTPDGGGSGWAGATSHRAGRIDAAALAKAAADKARRSQKPRKLDPGRYTVVLEHAAVAEILDFLTGSAFQARAADEGRNFFSKKGGGNKVGEKLFADAINIVSDPADPDAPGLPFDGQGLPRAPTVWIENGVQKRLFHSRYWAKKSGGTPDAVPHVYHLKGGTAASVDDLVRGTKRGLLVTRFFYSRWVDRQTALVTGLTRDGTFLIENGEIVAPVNNFRWNESVAAMLHNVEAMTKDSVVTPMEARMRVPAMRIAEFNMASISEAV
jgi:predicted Zn-dependent protease